MTANTNSPTVPQRKEIASRGQFPDPSRPTAPAGDLSETTYPLVRQAVAWVMQVDPSKAGGTIFDAIRALAQVPATDAQ